MSILGERIRQKHRTMSYPDGQPPELSDRWLGEPAFDPGKWRGRATPEFCPSGAITGGDSPALDVGRCVFCGACRDKGPENGVSFSRRYAMARFGRSDLVLGDVPPAQPDADAAAGAERLRLIRSLFSRSLKLRQVSAGGCNACEADSNVLGTLAWDISRFGLSFVASPRHADGILVTGPVTGNMLLALKKTYDAVPAPKVVIAVGACAVSGGLYGDGTGRGVLERTLPVDLFIPGCPPHPLVILEGLLRLIGRIPDLPAKTEEAP